MGGRGASSGMSISGKKYGTEYTTLHTSGNIKFIKYNDSSAAKSPMETMTKGRVYVTVNKDNKLTSIVYFDKVNKRIKQIDLLHAHKTMIPHAHHGYFHNELDGIKGATKLTVEERKMVDRIIYTWYNKVSK